MVLLGGALGISCVIPPLFSSFNAIQYTKSRRVRKYKSHSKGGRDREGAFRSSEQVCKVVLTHSLAPQLKAYSGGLYKALRPLANAYARAVGHRQVGLRYDDLIVEEREDVQKVSGV